MLDARTGGFLQRDPLMQTRTAGRANPYSFAWNNPVKFIDQSGAQPVADQGGTVAGGLAAVGALATAHLSPVPGENIEPYIEMRWACNADHDCIKAVEMVYPLTDFEQQLRQAYHSGKSPERGWLWDSSYYRVVLDKLSGAVLGYAMFQTNVIDVYDREGRYITLLGRSEGTAATWFQPGDFLAGRAPVPTSARRLDDRLVERGAEHMTIRNFILKASTTTKPKKIQMSRCNHMQEQDELS